MTTDPCTHFPPARMPARPVTPRVLSIAGTDPSGGAGTAADLKSITAAGGYGMAVVTAVVAQNTHGVRAIHVPPTAILAAQLAAVGDDVELEAVKTGMLGTAEVIETVAEWIAGHPPRVLVVDPVMVATSGDRLLAPEAEQAMLRFCRAASVVTPNIDELAVLTGSPRARTAQEAIAQAEGWAAETGVAVVVKTGHLTGRELTTTWVGADGARHSVRSTRVDTTSTHGTGCSLSSALAARLGDGDSPGEALAWTTHWLHEAIEHGAALQVGTGHGPVDHAHRSRRLQAAGSSVPWLAADALPRRLEQPTDLAAASPEVAASVAPAGPWTAALWAASSSLAVEISRSGFVRALVDGSLSASEFSFYLAQDALYLNRYSRSLAVLAESSADPAAREFWAGSSAHCLEVETELHRSWLSRLPKEADAAISPVTSAYTDFLLAQAMGSPTAVAAAAVLPCFWLYAQVGGELPHVAPDHPYAAWLETYRDPEFVAGVAGALRVVERELAAASPEVRAEAARAHLLASRHELEFFEQARRLLHHRADGADWADGVDAGSLRTAPIEAAR